MGWTTGTAVYLVLWWIVLFVVLPWGVEPVGNDEVVKGHAPSAPKQPRMLRKIIITTVLAALCWGVFYAVATSDLITFRE